MHTSPGANRTGRSRAIRLAAITAAVLMLSAGFTAVLIEWSENHYRLMIDPNYDDVVYFNGSLRRLNTLVEGGMSALVRSLLANPPHAPLSIVLGMAAFAVAGSNEAAPYAANGVLVAILLAGVIWLTRDSHWSIVATGIVLTLGTPLSAATVVEFRPDLGAAILTALAVAGLIQRRITEAPAAALIGNGLLWGAAFLAKSSVMPFTGWMFCVSLAASFLQPRNETDGGNARPVWKSAALLILPAALLAGPYYAASFEQVRNYIYDNMFGVNKDIWVTGDSLGEHVLYFINGLGAFVHARPAAMAALCAAGAGAHRRTSKRSVSPSTRRSMEPAAGGCVAGADAQ
jgi:hypothetical protein